MWCEYMKLLDKEKIEDSVMWSKKKELGKELEEMCNLSQYIKEGIMQGRKEGRKEGLVEGRKEGILVGVKKGKADEKMDIAKKMKVEGFSKEMIKKLTGIALN